jgi:predicted nucleic acid-binding protein
MMLLDTNVLSELRRKRPDERVLAFIRRTPYEQLFTSVIVMAEIRAGIERSQDPGVQVDLERWLANTVRPMFTGRVLGVSEDTLVRWRLMVANGRKIGRTYTEPDLLLAATALEHRFKFVTRNVKDFAGLDLPIINPWEFEE